MRFVSRMSPFSPDRPSPPLAPAGSRTSVEASPRLGPLSCSGACLTPRGSEVEPSAPTTEEGMRGTRRPVTHALGARALRVRRFPWLGWSVSERRGLGGPESSHSTWHICRRSLPVACHGSRSSGIHGNHRHSLAVASHGRSTGDRPVRPRVASRVLVLQQQFALIAAKLG
jgi:hypothetical protein